MSIIEKGKRYKFTFEGRGDAYGNLVGGDRRWTLYKDNFNYGTIELIEEPLPDTEGSIVVDSVGVAWQLDFEDKWTSGLGYATRSTKELLHTRKGLTVLLDTGATA